MEHSHFRVYVDIFDGKEVQDSTSLENSLQGRLDTYDIVSRGDILGTKLDEPLKSASANTEKQLKPGSNCEITGAGSSSNTGAQNYHENSIACGLKQRPKLCGFLKVHKTGDKIQHRRRWFVFNEDMCHLLYFRSPHDMIPRCDINIAPCSFYMNAPSGENALLNTFEIRSKDHVYFLEAANQKTMLYWLQELQMYREKYVTKKSKSLKFHMLQDGQQSEACMFETPAIIENVSLPRDTVGVQTRDDFRPGIGGAFAFTSIRDDLRKMMSGILQQQNNEQHFETGDPFVDSSQPSTPSSFNLKRTIISKTSDVKQKILGNKQSVDHGGSDIPSRASVASNYSCHRCSLYEDQIEATREEIESLEEELQATRELTAILQKHIDEFVREKMLSCALSQSKNSIDTGNKMLQQQEKRMISLEHLLAATQEEKEILKAANRSLEGEVEGLNDQINAFRDSVQSKDDVVINLTEQLFAYENQLGNNSDILLDISTASNSPHKSSLIQKSESIDQHQSILDNKEVQKYKDMVTGYKTQNQFLNKEIMELNQLRQEDSTRQQELIQTCLKLETQYYDEHRKYLASLKELGRSQCEDDPRSLQILESLLEDAITSRKQWRTGGVSDRKTVKNPDTSFGNVLEVITENNSRYDDLGFPVDQNESYEHDTFDDKIATIEKQSDEMYLKAKSIEEGLSTNLQWEKFMTNVGFGTPAQRSKELKYLIRAGIPQAHRSTVWKWCVDFQVAPIKAGFQENHYENLIEDLKNSTLLMSPTAKQIELDLLRTLPGNKYYENIMSDKVQALRRVLLAFSIHDPMVGYCQGLNRITAIALLFLKEEDAFWCLVSIVSCLLLPNYFCNGMQGAHTDQRVLVEILQEKLPALSTHLKNIKVDITVFTFNWFLTVYIDNIPPQMYLRIWDSFLYEGSKVLYRYAVAFFKQKEHDIMALSDSSEVHMYLRSLGQKMIDVNKIAKFAFEGMNPFPMKHINAKRHQHSAIVKAELLKMQEQRESYRRKRLPNNNADLIGF